MENLGLHIEEGKTLLKEFLTKIKLLEEQSGGRIQFHVRVPVESEYFLSIKPFTDVDGTKKLMYDIKETDIRVIRHNLSGELFTGL